MVTSRISTSCQSHGVTSGQSIAYSLADVTLVPSNYVMIWHVNAPLILCGRFGLQQSRSLLSSPGRIQSEEPAWNTCYLRVPTCEIYKHCVRRRSLTQCHRVRAKWNVNMQTRPTTKAKVAPLNDGSIISMNTLMHWMHFHILIAWSSRWQDAQNISFLHFTWFHVK